MNIKPAHIGISVRKMDDAISWYEKNLGFALTSRKFHESMNKEIAFLSLEDGFQVELFCSPEPIEPPEGIYRDNSIIGTKHIAFEVDDIDSLLETLAQNGVEIIFKREMGGDVIAFIRDLCGTPLELIEKGAAGNNR